MAGVQVGTRLDQLLRLQARIGLEIAAERQQNPAPRPVAPPPAPVWPPTLEDLGVSSLEVKRWAKCAGLIPEVRRGQIGGRIVQAYEEAHRGDVALLRCSGCHQIHAVVAP